MIFDFIDTTTLLTDSLSGLIVASITALVGYLIFKKYAGRISFTRRMNEYGFSKLSTGRQTKFEIKRMCETATKIQIINVAGKHYLNANEVSLKRALSKGVEVQFLCAQVNSDFLHDIEALEMSCFDNEGRPYREQGNLISNEIMDIYNKFKGSGLKMRCFNTQYRLPLVIAYYPDESVDVWLQMTLPPYKSTKSFVLRGFSDESRITRQEANFVDMIIEHFDKVWEQSEPIENVLNSVNSSQEKRWMSLQDEALKKMQSIKSNGGILIEIAAQHPLKDGRLPNVEFEKRLLAGYKFYKEELHKGENVKIYVPGSIHMYNNLSDKVSLSEAGTKFLVDLGVNKADIFGEEANRKYKGEDGVYNSTDECYVATRIFLDSNFGRLVCFCSPAQLTRKALSYIRFGVFPEMFSVPADKMFHNYVNEVFNEIPTLLEDANALQGDSIEGQRLRNARKPKC